VTVEAAQAQPNAVAARPADLAPVANAATLLDHGLAGLRGVVLDVLATGLRAADPVAAVDEAVTVSGSSLRVGGRSFDLDDYGAVVVLGAGKASLSIAAGLERKLGDRIDRGLVVRRRGQPGGLDRIEVLDADHPVPSEASLVAGRRLVDAAGQCRPGDLLITAFTGGSSALACVPPDGVDFVAKQALHAMLLDSGASIAEVNTVRKHVSQIKGGRLAALANGATIVNLTLSDVVGDAVDLLCDVVVPDSTDCDGAVAVLRRYGLWEAVDPAIRAHLSTPEAESPSLAGLDITTTVLVTGATVVDRMAERVRALGCTPAILGTSLAGDGGALGALLGSLASESSVHGRPFAAGTVLVAAGGEATVSIQRREGVTIGAGGPNQEVAVAFARAVAGGARAAAGFVDSDGSDGGTEAAGGCVDSSTLPSARAMGVDLDSALIRHDCQSTLERLGDLVVTGPTGTNISDLLVVAIETSTAEPGTGPS